MNGLELGADIKTGKKIRLTPSDRFGHMVIVGPTGCGKTSKIIKPGIWQDLIEIKRKRTAYRKLLDKIEHDYEKGLQRIRKNKTWSLDKKQSKVIQLIEKKDKRLSKINKQDYIAGLTVIEPKGDLAEDVVKMCKKLNLNDYKFINPMNEDTDIFNIMQGEADEVAETNRTVLKNLFGKQEQFFSLIQETTARNTILLIKRLRGDALDLIDVARTLRDEDILRSMVDKYESEFGEDDLVQFFRAEVYGTLKDKFYQFALGLRQQLEDIGGNKYLKRVLIGNSTVNLDKHLEEGGILIVNTCMGRLGILGDTFGEFVIMHLQNAVFRRPGSEWTRPNHYIWIDEAPRYMNPDLERLLAIGRSYRASANMSIQVSDQLVLSERKELAGILMANWRTKIVLGGLPEQDAKMFSEEFGKDVNKTKQYTYNYKSLIAVPSLVPKNYRTTEKEENRFLYTDIMELKSYKKRAEAIIKYIHEGAVQCPVKIMTRVRNYDTMPLEFIIGDYMERLRKKLWFNAKAVKELAEAGVELAAVEIKSKAAEISEKIDKTIEQDQKNTEILNILKQDINKTAEVKAKAEPTLQPEPAHIETGAEACTYTFALDDPEAEKEKALPADPEEPKKASAKPNNHTPSITKEKPQEPEQTEPKIKKEKPGNAHINAADTANKKPSINKNDWW